MEQFKINALSPNIFKSVKGIVEKRITERKYFIFDKSINC